MKTPAIRAFRQKLAADEPVYGLWVTLESASITEMGVALGLDWVVVDAEHGHLDWRDILEHVRATVRSDTVVLVRVTELNIGLIKRALDIGADGVVVPWVESVEQVRDAVAFAHYPPEGLRGIGAERATCWGQCFVEHVAEADEHVLVVPIIESVQAGQNIHALLEVPGVEMFFFGPADYSSTAGYPGQWEGPGVAEQILAAKDAIRAGGKHCGVVATSNDNLAERREQGFRMLGLGLDGGLLLRSLRQALESTGRDRQITPAFAVDQAPATPVPPPASALSDPPEMVNPPGSGVRTEVIPGVVFEALVGEHNQVPGLTTGISTFAPGAHLAYHYHPYPESLTLLSGEAIVEVEGRMYDLEQFDNATIPAGRAHALMNPASHEPAVFHAALPTHRMERELVDQFFSRRRMPDDAAGPAGGERVVRHRMATLHETSPGISGVDLFNGDLVPGMEISGGFGWIQPGSRQPPHTHEVDAATTVVQGTAICTVEGRPHPLAERSVVLVPRGRLHCFANEMDQPVALIWVCNGPALLRATPVAVPEC